MGSSFGRRGSAPAVALPRRAMPVLPSAMAVAEAAAEPTVTEERNNWPLLTTGILLVLIGLFWAEQKFAVDKASGFDPGLGTLIALGGMSRELVFVKGEWWRAFTATYLHGGLSHIIGNGIALFFAGRWLEKTIGRSWLAALFVLGGLGGSIGSLLLDPTNLVSVGASGAIMAMLATLFVISFDQLVAKNPGRVRMRVLFLLVPALMPDANSGVDVSAHVGGAITGGLLGFFLQAVWSEEQDAPDFKQVAAWIAGIGAALTVVSFALVWTHYSYAAEINAAIPETKMIAEADYPASYDDGVNRSSELVEKYPDDPRAHLFRALALIKVNDPVTAAEHLRIALSQKRILDDMPPQFTAMLQILLATVMLDEGRQEDARNTAAPACETAAEDGGLSDIMSQLKDRGVCP